MTYIEIKAEVYRVIRAYEGSSAKVALEKVKAHLGADYDAEFIQHQQ